MGLDKRAPDGAAGVSIRDNGACLLTITLLLLRAGAIVTAEVDNDGGYTESVGGYQGHQLLVVAYGPLVAPKHEDFVVQEAVISAADIGSLHAAMFDDRRCCKLL